MSKCGNEWYNDKLMGNTNTPEKVSVSCELNIASFNEYFKNNGDGEFEEFGDFITILVIMKKNHKIMLKGDLMK